MHLSTIPSRLLVMAVAGLTACGSQESGDDSAMDADSDAAMETAGDMEPGVVPVVAKDFEFEAPREIPSGWTTFRLTNEGEQEHFAYVYKLPEGVDFAAFRQGVTAPFIRIWNQYDAGEITADEFVQNLGNALPAWFADVRPSGGVAMTEPGETALTTVNLDPGTYVIECYVKTPQGTWHTDRGMLKELTVTAEANGVQPPAESDAVLTLSNYEIAVEGELQAGQRIVEVQVEENPEGFNMHDVNLVRLEGEATVDEVVEWMNWMALDQFRAPAPGYSLGGVDQIVAGRTGYITVDLTPGRYLWVSEGYGAQGMTHEFTIE